MNPISYVSLTERLFSAGIGDRETCRFEALVLLSHFAGLTRETLPFRKADCFSSPELLSAVEKRLAHYPLQYLVGEWDFYHETYEVNEHCLIPRPDTELLVEIGIELLPENGRFLDLCTGSGCIAVSLLASRRDASALLVDLFPETLSLAMRNAEKNRVGDRASCLLADALSPFDRTAFGRFELILSNPPYIRRSVVETLSPEVQFEPRAALDGGEDGLDFYRAILKNAPPILKEGGKILFEIGYDQGEAILCLSKEAGFLAEICQDLGGRDRVAILTKI